MKKGEYEFENLRPIYCIGFMAHDIFSNSKEYYHFGTMQNQYGEEMDSQITHIIIEISKFDKQESEIHTNLDKLIYIMKNLEAFNDGLDIPEFITEEWLAKAIKRLDTVRMTKDEMMHYEMMLVREVSRIKSQKEEQEAALEEAVAEVVDEAVGKAVEKAVKKTEKALDRMKKEKEEIEKMKEAAEKKKEAAEKKREQVIAKMEKAAIKAEKQAKETERRTFALKLKAKGMPDVEIAELSGLSLNKVKRLK